MNGTGCDWLVCAIEFARKRPVLDLLLLVIPWLSMYRAWKRSGLAFMEADAPRRQAGAKALTNQINGATTVVSIILAGIGATLTLGHDKGLPTAAQDHLGYAVLWCLSAILVGIYTLGYISSPTVIHQIDVSKKATVQLAAFIQLTLIVLAAGRFGLALRHLLK